jgi:hypothetical protein
LTTQLYHDRAKRLKFISSETSKDYQSAFDRLAEIERQVIYAIADRDRSFG